MYKFFEYKLTTENYSKYYYLVLRFDDRTLSGLAKGEFAGLKGISDDIKIVNAFFDIRPMLLVMDKEKVDKINEIEKFDYFNIDFLVKDNFKNFKSILQYDDDYEISYILYQSFRKVFELFGEISSASRSENHQLIKLRRIIGSKKYQPLWKTLDHYSNSVFDKIKYVKDFDDFISQFNRNMYGEKIWDKLKFIEWDKKMVRTCLEFLIINHASIFEHEGELLVKSETFKIPDGSILLIKEELFAGDSEADINLNVNSNENNIRLMNKYMDDLKNRLKFKIIPYAKGGIISSTHKSAFSFIRYLDKLKKFNEWE